MNITVITQPSVEPVSLADAKLWLKIDDSDEDALIDGLLSTARLNAELTAQRSLITQTIQLDLDYSDYADKREIRLLMGPVQSVTSITYQAVEGSYTAWDPINYRVDVSGRRIILKNSCLWPNVDVDSAALRIVYVAGYGDTAVSIPKPIITAIKFELARLYENRGVMAERDVDFVNAFRALLFPFRPMDF